MRNKLLSYWLIGFLTFLFLTPIFGWHIHHACLEGAHGFECHSGKVHNDKSHGRECQSESLFQHVFEQGAAYSMGDALDIPVWDACSVTVCLDHFQYIVPRHDVAVSYLELDRDIGIGQEESDSILLRAPPVLLS